MFEAITPFSIWSKMALVTKAVYVEQDFLKPYQHAALKVFYTNQCT